MSILIRQALLSDAPMLAQAERTIAMLPGFLVSSSGELTDQKFENTIAKILSEKQGQYLVAIVGEEIVGHAMLEPLHLQSICHVAHLTLVVHQGWEGKGIGKLLLAHLIAWAKRSQNLEKIELQVRSSNRRAIALYEKMGFCQEGCLKKRVKIGQNQYIDDIVMALFVKESE